MFVIYGTQGVTAVIGNGTFLCPRCTIHRPYLRKSVRSYFSIFLVPLIPLDRAGEYIECQFCSTEFDERVLIDYPAALEAKAEADVVEHFKRLMMHAALVSEHVTDAKIDAIRRRFHEYSRAELSKAYILQELNLARLAKAGLSDYPRQFPGRLDVPAREEAIKAVFTVLTADSELGDNERKFLDEIAAEMELTPTHLRALLSDLSQAKSPG